MKTRWLSAVATIAVLVATACTSAASQVPNATQKTGPAKVRVGYLLGDLHHMAHIVAQDSEAGGGKSFYEKYDLAVEDGVGAPYANGGAEMDHFAANDLDVGMLGAPPAITKHLNAGVDTVIVGQVNEIGSALVVAKNINRFSDLVGQTVATPGHSTIQFFLLRTYAEQQGVDVGKINLVDMAPKDMRAKMETGQIAGFIAWEPFVAEAAVTGFGKVLVTSQDIWPNHLDCVLLADRRFAREQPAVVERFVKAQRDATEWVIGALGQPNSKDYARLVELAVKFTGRDAEVVKEAFKNVRFKNALDAGFTRSLVQYTEKLIEFNIVGKDKLAERGYRSAEDFAEKYVDISFQKSR